MRPSSARRTRAHNERVIRVLIADDQQLVRTGFRVILEAEGDIEVVARGRRTACEAVERVRQHSRSRTSC